MELTDEQERQVTALLDGLLPGTAQWPAAGSLGLAPDVARLAALDPQQPVVLAGFLDALPAGISSLHPDARHGVMVEAEASNPEGFGLMLRLAYNAYYTNPDVLRILEARTGYEARPPQPNGYELPEFDESILETVRRREPLWRSV